MYFYLIMNKDFIIIIIITIIIITNIIKGMFSVIQEKTVLLTCLESSDFLVTWGGKEGQKRARDMRAVRGRRATVFFFCLFHLCYSKRETSRRLVFNLRRVKRHGTLCKDLYGEAPSERASIFGFRAGI